MRWDVSVSISRQSAVIELYTVQRVSVESYVTNLLLPITGNLDGRQRRLSAQSAKSNIMMLSALGFSEMNFLISIPESGRNRC